MKNTLVSVFVIVFFNLLFSNKALALLPPINDIRDNIKITLPTATPKPLDIKPINPDINFKLISTVAPTLGTKITVTPVPTIEEKLENTPTVKKTSPSETELTTTETQTQIVEPSVEVTKNDEKTENKVDLKTWFMGITMGLLALIIIIQLFPKKKED